MKPSRLVVDGKLTVPLFHGTSTVFHESILESGLGGRSVVEELGVRAAAQALLGHEDALTKFPEWPMEKYFLLKMAQDPPSQIPANATYGFNFRYGGAYLTPSRQSAINYALYNKEGSEAIRGILKVLDVLVKRLPQVASQAVFSNILRFARLPREPMLIEAHEVDVLSLRAEQGGDNAPVLADIEAALEDPDIYEVMTSQSNFELIRPIPASQLHFYRIAGPHSGHESLEALQLEPL